MHVDTNYLTYGTNTLNTIKKLIKTVKRKSPNTNAVLSSVMMRKDKKDISKMVSDVNSRLKIFCAQKNIDFIENSNIKEAHLGV